MAGPGDVDVKREVVRARSAVAPICAKSTIPKSYLLKVLSDISRFSSTPRSDVKVGCARQVVDFNVETVL